VERTAGWFTAAYPLVIEVGPSAAVSAEGAAALEWVKRVREAKAGVPGGGEGYGLVRYVSEGEAARAQQRAAEGAEAEVSFNYLGQFDQSFTEDALFELAPESSGAAQAADEQRSHLLQVTALVADKQFRVDWSYSENVHLASTIERLADECMRVLRALVAHSQTDKVDEYNPSDFADFAWGQDEIASIVAVIDNLE
jgi:non-ribosomal peptide synthase protein (TIGR01720 family)